MYRLRELDLDDLLELTDEEDKLLNKKLKISKIIYETMKERNLSMKKVADQIEGIGSANVSRIVHGENYKINALLKVLELLDLELEVVPKKVEK